MSIHSFLNIYTVYNVCSVHRGMFSTSRDVQYIGGYHEYIGGYHEYHIKLSPYFLDCTIIVKSDISMRFYF